MARNLRVGVQRGLRQSIGGGLGTGDIFTLSQASFDFSRTNTIDSRITFSRASSGTFVGADGLIKTTPSDAPRFDHNPLTGESLGLLLEKANTNKNTYSLFDDWSVTNISKKSTNNLAPDGTNTALMIGDSTGSATSSYLKKAINAVGSGKHVFTFYAKGTTTNQSAFVDYYDAGANRARGGINLGDGSTTSNLLEFGDATITSTNAGNGWWRCQLTLTPVGTSVYQWRVGNNDSGDILIWGAQLEQGSFPTSYIPTSGSTVTRATDTAEITGTNFSGFFNQSEGTIFFENAQNTVTNIPFAYDFSDGTTNNSHRFLYISTSTPVPIKVRTKVSNSNVTDISFTAPSVGQFQKTAYGYKANDFALSVNGASVLTDTNGAVPTVIDKLTIGDAFSGVNAFSGYIKRLSYFSTRQPNTILQSITS